MAVDMFMKIEGIDGEKPLGEIEIESFSWGLSQSGAAAATGGAGAGKVQFQGFHFTSGASKASPKLFLACASGQHLKDATLSCRKSSGESPQTFLVVKMNDVLISSYQTSGGGEQPTESVSLNFTKITFSYTPQKPDGSAGTPVSAGWDVKANAKV